MFFVRVLIEQAQPDNVEEVSFTADVCDEVRFLKVIEQMTGGCVIALDIERVGDA
jgi:hypothetical protein